jgi:hypothetical protein
VNALERAEETWADQGKDGETDTHEGGKILTCPTVLFALMATCFVAFLVLFAAVNQVHSEAAKCLSYLTHSLRSVVPEGSSTL